MPAPRFPWRLMRFRIMTGVLIAIAGADRRKVTIIRTERVEPGPIPRMRRERTRRQSPRRRARFGNGARHRPIMNANSPGPRRRAPCCPKSAGILSLAFAVPLPGKAERIAKTAAAADMGVVALPAFTCREEVSAGHLVRVLPPLGCRPIAHLGANAQSTRHDGGGSRILGPSCGRVSQSRSNLLIQLAGCLRVHRPSIDGTPVAERSLELKNVYSLTA